MGYPKGRFDEKDGRKVDYDVLGEILHRSFDETATEPIVGVPC